MVRPATVLLVTCTAHDVKAVPDTAHDETAALKESVAYRWEPAGSSVTDDSTAPAVVATTVGTHPVKTPLDTVHAYTLPPVEEAT